MKQLPIVLCLLIAACSSSKKASTDGSTGSGKKDGTYAHLYSKDYHPLLNESTFKLDSISVDKTFGYTIENPVMVGGNIEEGARNERRFLNALLGPGGERISYNRLGSCCSFSSPNGFMGGGLLDKYEIKIEGSSTTLIIYINMYDRGVLKAPKGFTFKKD